MHTYRKDGKDAATIWTVGYYTRSDGGYDRWNPLKDFKNEVRAAAYANYLNGGAGHDFGECLPIASHTI